MTILSGILHAGVHVTSIKFNFFDTTCSKKVAINSLLFVEAALTNSTVQEQWVAKRGMDACPPPRRSWKFFQIFMYFVQSNSQHLSPASGASPQTLTGALPLHPAGGLPSLRPPLLSPR